MYKRQELHPQGIAIEGIESITLADLKSADELGYRIKLLGVAQRSPQGIEQRVHPTMVPKSSAIAQVMGVVNAVTIDADAVHELTLVGPGAGGEATASAVVADIADIAKGIRSAPFGLPVSSLAKAKQTPMQMHQGGYYIRLSVHDRPGAAAVSYTHLHPVGSGLFGSVFRRQSAAVRASGAGCEGRGCGIHLHGKNLFQGRLAHGLRGGQ